MPKLVDVSAYPIWDVINVLLEDKTTGKNVVWATDAYAARGPGYGPEDPITKSAFTGDDPVLIQPRIEKDVQEQQARTKKKAEVYTPSWLCNKMNNYCDAEWFGRPKVFNEENGGGAWTARKEPIWFNEKKGRKTKEWQKYVDSRRLEITCGEAPFLVSRYDAATGDILPIDQRIGILDRKLRVVNENTTSETEWLKWAQRAVESCYGYEYQGDSLLIARNNVLMTFYDYYTERWKKLPEKRLFKKIANIVAWNIWQMDGLTDAPPFGKTVSKKHDYPLFQQLKENVPIETAERVFEKPSKINNWRSKKSFTFIDLKGILIMKNKNKLFDFVIGNPPYQGEQKSTDISGSQKNYAPPVYHLFMESVFPIGDKVELVHPARFLFNAGSTPKDWNQKMLEDEHFKVLEFHEDSNVFFPSLSTPLKGGIAITYRDSSKKFGAIQVFTQFPEVNSVVHKVISHPDYTTFMNIIYPRTSYRLTNKLHSDHPSAITKLSKGHAFDMASNIFDRLPEIFYDEKPDDGKQYIRIYGRTDSKRLYKYVRQEYVNKVENLFFYKVFVPQANGEGIFGEALAQPVIGNPGDGTTETFISIGKFNTKQEAISVVKYISTKFARTLLNVLKVTQSANKGFWRMIPLQDFTSQSKIDWSQTIANIDQQLYMKYGLSQEEITFIETHVKEMN